MTRLIGICLAVYVLVAQPLPARADELPRFDGVYVELDNGEFLQANRIDSIRPDKICLLGTSAVRDGGPIYLTPNQRSLEATHAGYFDVKSIFVRGRNEEVKFVYFLVRADEYFEGSRIGLVASTQLCIGRGKPNTKAVQEFWNSLFAPNCGRRTTTFNILSEAENATQLFPKNGDNWMNAHTLVGKDGQCGGTGTVPLRGMLIATDVGYYPILFNK